MTSFFSPLIARTPYLISAISISVLSACSNPEQAQPPKGPLPVTVLTVEAQNLPRTLEITAQTEGSKEIDIRPRVGGLLTEKFIQEGQSVHAGQALFQIDRAPYEIALIDAKARFEQSERERQRMQTLLDSQSISQKDYDTAKTAYDLAQAQLKQAELNLSWTKVTAPVAGRVGRAHFSEGNLVSPTTEQALTTLQQTHPVWVRFALGDSELAQLPKKHVQANGQPIRTVQLLMANGEPYEHPGKLNYIAPNLDTTLGTQALRAEFPNPDGAILPGQFVRVRLTTGERKGVFLVPQSAVIQSEQGTLVMTATAENQVAPRPVKTGEWQGKNWVILEGLKNGDQVIIDNLMKLRPGAPIQPKPAGAAGSSPAPASPAPKG